MQPLATQQNDAARPGLKAPLSRVVCLFVLLAGCSPLMAIDLSGQATQLVQRLWTIDDGLPAEVAWAVHQSSDGYLWVATNNGLARFDGLTFKVFNAASHDAFKSNDIRDVTEGPAGTVWAASVGGGLLQIRNGEVSRIDVTGGLSSDAVYSVMVARNGDTWAGTASGVCRLRETDIRCWAESDGLSSGRIVRLAEDAENRIWFGSVTGGLSMFDGVAMKRFGIEEGLKHLDVYMIIADPEHNLLVGTGSGELYHADPDGVYLFENPELPESFAPLNALRDREGNVLVAMFGGLWQLSPEVRRIDNPGDNISYVLDVAEDDKGGIWAATSSGLYQFMNGPFVPFGEAEGVADETFVVAAGVGGSVWVGTEMAGTFNVYPDGRVRNVTKNEGLPHNSVSALMVDPDGTVWIGTFGGGVAVLRDDSVVAIINQDSGLPGNQIGSIFRDSRGDVWIGTSAGLARWEEDRVTLTRTAADGLLANLVRDIREDAAERLLLAGDNGLSVMSLANEEIVDTITSEDGLTNDVVATTYVDERGVIWIGSRSGGLSRLDGKTLFHYEPEHGIGLTSIMSVIEDDERYLWLAGRDGIVRIPRTDLDAVATGEAANVQSVAFSTRDGLRSTRVPGGYQSAAAHARDGRIWFATGRGLAAVNPATLTTVQTPTGLRIDAIRADNQTIAGEPPYRIPAGTQTVQIDYSVPSLGQAESLRFQYRLGGGRWQDAGERRTAFFTSLPPRSQTFEVATTYKGMPYSSGATTVEIFVEPRWFESRFVRLVAVLLSAFIAMGAYSLALRRYRHRQEQLQQLVDERTLALQEALSDMEKMSKTDMLTGVANRRHFEERMREQWSRAIRKQQAISVMMIDIDHFKQFNDSAGHQAGDRCLVAVAQALQGSVRDEDFVSRYGGEEFAVLMSGSKVSAMCEIGKRLQDGIRALNLAHPGLAADSIVTVSGGFASILPQPSDQFEELIRRADYALYRAKEQGRDRIIVDHPDGRDSLTITTAIAIPAR